VQNGGFYHLKSPMFHIALFEPEIAPNTGNIIRLCANTGAKLHLIKPYGFDLDDKKLRRAGLDYHEWANVKEYDNFDAFYDSFQNHNIYALTTKGKTPHSDIEIKKEDVFLFGPESRGLPIEVREKLGEDNWIRLPMMPDSRSLNLSNSAAVLVYEAWRQLGYEGAL